MNEEMDKAYSLLELNGFIKKYRSGIYCLDSYGLFLKNQIEKVIRDEMYKIGFNEVSLPALTLVEDWQKSRRFESYSKEGFIANQKWLLAPTCEEVVTVLFSEPIQPIKIFQIEKKFRNELRPRYNLNRSCEFWMKDGYSIHFNTKELDKTYMLVRRAYIKIFKRLRINVSTNILASDSDMKSGFCEEFRFLDKKNEKTNEIEVGHIFKLGNYFHNIMFNKDYFMGCYGIGVSRLIFVLCLNFFNGKRLVLPAEFSPILVGIITDKKHFAIKIIKKWIKNTKYKIASRTEILCNKGSLTKKLSRLDEIGAHMRIIIKRDAISIEKIKNNNSMEIKVRTCKLSLRNIELELEGARRYIEETK